MCDVMCLSVCTRAYILLGGRVVVVLQKTANFVECIYYHIYLFIYLGEGVGGDIRLCGFRYRFNACLVTFALNY